MSNFPQGLGIDIIEIERFQKTLKRSPQIIKKLFTAQEIRYCSSQGKNKILHFAGRFAAKEALAKALGTGFGKRLGFLDIEILNSKSGRPEASLSKKLKQQFPKAKILISISHSKTAAAACALLYSSPIKK